ncbi:MAG: hypothetical protein A2268_10305 [Candidatus Raymondbacteria bacterium RifOxyA12_full_50_37]|uniref:Uncharacterized protein n=1 Tax=Candidatus Raymondbacteria bacterium RIFOXYD12_FULL_49_13 TaxID=1817890 RepID=A0A1F7FKM5_UNCRA|nr:MAG: hypothetical protein A2268_10305 [Candidatus Raymondbacteria bacterium RifOxyA12_full_50_37]OGJ90155.1 MAG: hypothetical protein A2248_16785 [Candidatus Raymondbacteria bacterium RIFOXYA2_FULL_49_16]OGJ97226.1 MAG: hypothetical protein A2453_01275 [Candidatus Raymondbacteria bacterium RIFOXYC2_FULL_50_21]OGK04494.1 MAG: hypothetical protein A2350_15315 [Candidatus Raymondbacteria bacterium RifOxyB12_full_50_8]OGK07141.1 MAG: hypothetical protein A2519_09315 [Candidatus Raymondbacteria b
MAFYTLQELKVKYNLNDKQRARIKEAINSRKIRFQVNEEPLPMVTGKNNPGLDTKIAVLKIDEDDVRKILEM